MKGPSHLPHLGRRSISPRRSLLVNLVVEVAAIASALFVFGASFMDAREEATQVRAPEQHEAVAQAPAR